MEMFNKILVAIDGSTTSRKVFEAGLSLARTTGASLMLLHVLCYEEKDPFIYSGLEWDPFQNSIRETNREQRQKLEQQGQELLHSLTEEATKAGVKTECNQTWDNPKGRICEEAQIWSAEIILVGSRGLTGVQEMLLGSVSNYVTHHAPCSVLIVREEEKEIVSPPM